MRVWIVKIFSINIDVGVLAIVLLFTIFGVVIAERIQNSKPPTGRLRWAVLIAILGLFASVLSAYIIPQVDNVSLILGRGNSIFNNPSSFIAEDDDNIFYIENVPGTGLANVVKKSKKRSETTAIAFDLKATDKRIQVFNDWVYYIKDRDLFRVKSDGSSEERLEKECISDNFIVVDDRIYYSEFEDLRVINPPYQIGTLCLYSLSTDGSDKKTFKMPETMYMTFGGSLFDVVNGLLYYKRVLPQKLEIEYGTIKVSDFSNNSVIYVASAGESVSGRETISYDGNIYGVNDNECFKLDSERGFTRLNDFEAWFGWANVFGIDTNYVYFTEYIDYTQVGGTDEGYMLYRVNLEGQTKTKELVAMFPKSSAFISGIQGINVVNDIYYALIYEGDGYSTKIRVVKSE